MTFSWMVKYLVQGFMKLTIIYDELFEYIIIICGINKINEIKFIIIINFLSVWF